MPEPVTRAGTVKTDTTPAEPHTTAFAGLQFQTGKEPHNPEPYRQTLRQMPATAETRVDRTDAGIAQLALVQKVFSKFCLVVFKSPYCANLFLKTPPPRQRFFLLLDSGPENWPTPRANSASRLQPWLVLRKLNPKSSRPAMSTPTMHLRDYRHINSIRIRSQRIDSLAVA